MPTELPPYAFTLALLGLALFGAAWLPHALREKALPFPLLYVLIGLVLYGIAWPLELPLPLPDPITHGEFLERLAELAVLVSLMSVGLRIDTAFGWRRWSLTWRLLAITMPLCIAFGTWLGMAWLDLGLAAALLLGASLAPTDPVLAADVQVAAPGKGGEDPVRFALTSEAGLNDALAFPFVWLALALAAHAAGDTPFSLAHWFTLDVLWRCASGVGVGWGLGYVAMRFLFRGGGREVSRSREGLAALAVTLLVYGVAELMHGYGFLAVFVAALAIRQYERNHQFHETLDTFVVQCERVLMVILLILFGGALALGVAADLDTPAFWFALTFVFVVRPATGLLALTGCGLPWPQRLAIAFFGVRGIGSLFYLAFGLTAMEFVEAGTLWGTVLLVIAMSLLLHGLSATPVLRWIDRETKQAAGRGD
ncbi:MAG TPA: cation:proton antiporter [Candidatus Limnocylindrales bacterium]